MEISSNLKILVDAVVIIHFIKGNQIGLLHRIFENKIYLFDVVFEEIFINPGNRTIVENLINYRMIKEICIDNCSQEVKREYFRLQGSSGGNRGKGESAIMAYCRYNNDVLASSNLRDIRSYCDQHRITYLTTMDFLAEAFRKSLLNEKECDDFIANVKSKGSKLIAGIDRIRDYSTR